MPLTSGGTPSPDIGRLGQSSGVRSRLWSNSRRGAPVRIPKHFESAALTEAILQADRSAQQQAEEHASVERVASSALDHLASSTLHSQAPLWTASRKTRAQPAFPDDDIAYRVGQLAKNNRFEDALALLQQLVLAADHKALCRVSQRYFMRYMGSHKAARHALTFLNVLPVSIHTINTYNLALDACAAAKDTDTATKVLELCIENSITPDTKLMTTYMKVFMVTGAVDRAYGVFMDMKRRGLPLDPHVVGTLVHAFAQAMTSGNEAAHERKNKLVLMERALSVFKEAEEQGMRMNITCWNSLMVCAGRCGQLKRAFEMLDTIQHQGLRADAYTYGSLMEACIQGGRTQLAQRLFNQALMEGHTSHVELYTLATTACRTPNAVNWQQAMRIFNTMQRHAVPPDTTYYAALMAVAGHAGHVEHAFELLKDMMTEGLRPNGAICAALIYACLRQQHLGVARKVYNLCASQGCYPDVSQYNRLMDVYASERRFGDVVSLLSDMTQMAGLQPNLNTYRIIINACQHADQAALAFEVFAVMKANKVPIQQEKFAITMYHTLLKCCLNMLRHIWAAHHPHPAPWASGSRTSRPVVRLAEARQVLLALGSSLEVRGASSLLLQDLSASMWTQYALSTYRDMLARGWKPNTQVLDKLMTCLRIPSSVALKHSIATGRLLDAHSSRVLAAVANATSNVSGSTGTASSTTHNPNGNPNGTSSLNQFSWVNHLKANGASPNMDGVPGVNPLQITLGQGMAQAQAEKYQLVFERRAIGVVEDAIARGLLPSFTVDEPCTIDLTIMPPTLAEVYTAALLTSLERRAARARSSAGAEGSAEGDTRLFYHQITLVVPPYDPQYVMWPSYVPKLTAHQSEGQTPEEEEQYQQQSRRRARVSRDPVPSNQSDTPLNGDHHHHDDNQEHSEHHHEQGVNAVASDESRRRDDVDASPPRPMGHPSTGLAVAATLRRMKFFMRGDPSGGIITLEKSDILAWVRGKRTYEARQSGALNPAGAPQGAAAITFQRTPHQHIPEGMMGQRPPSPYGSVQDAAPEHASGSNHMGASRPGSTPGAPRMGSMGGMPSPADQQMRIRLGMEMNGGGSGEVPVY